MRLDSISAVVTGGASGLGLATVATLAARGSRVIIADLPTSAGAQRAAELGEQVRFVPTDVTQPDQLEATFAAAAEWAPLGALVHCAGRGGPMRLLNRDGQPGDRAHFEAIVRTNLIGTFDALRLASAQMCRNEPDESGERGACVLTASVAAFEGQVGQISYTASKAGVVGMTLCAARDLASHGIRVCTIAPGVIDTPLLRRGKPEALAALAAMVPFPKRLGRADEFADLARTIVENGYLNGETIRLDGAIRMAPR
jgi:NAD(P)-dependent dehydrogenase (short-subunit alcohol dehydrogenase family)